MIIDSREQYEIKRAKRTMQEMIMKTRMEGNNFGSLLNSLVLAESKTRMDVAEIYSPPRATEMAKKLGLRAGWSMDITTIDEEGRPWDPNQVAMRNTVVRKF